MKTLCESLKLTYDETLNWIKNTYGNNFYNYFININSEEQERTIQTILYNL